MQCRISIMNRKTGSRDFIGTNVELYVDNPRVTAINTDFDHAKIFSDFDSALIFWNIHHNDLCELIDWSTEYYDFRSVTISNEENQSIAIHYPNKVVAARITDGRKGYDIIELLDDNGPMMLIPYNKEAMSFLDTDTIIADYRIQYERTKLTNKYGGTWRV